MNTENNRKFILISIFVVLLFGVILAGAPALADEWTHDFDDLIKTNEPRLINDQATETAKQPDAEDDSEYQESISSTSTTDTATLLQNMVQDFENNTFTQKGWLHYAYYHESEVPNGVALPKNYFVDGWYLINEGGFVTQNVVSFYDDAGNLNQRGIFKDNTFFNLTTKEEFLAEGPYKLKLDLGVTKGMLEMEMLGSILILEDSTLNEKPVNKFTVIGNHQQPIDLSNSSQSVKSVRKTVIFNQETGAITEMETVFILIDGTEEVFYRAQITTLEWGDLPQELIQLLEGKNE